MGNFFDWGSLVVNTLVAAGTIAAVIVALVQSRAARLTAQRSEETAQGLLTLEIERNSDLKRRRENVDRLSRLYTLYVHSRRLRDVAQRVAMESEMRGLLAALPVTRAAHLRHELRSDSPAPGQRPDMDEQNKIHWMTYGRFEEWGRFRLATKVDTGWAVTQELIWDIRDEQDPSVGERESFGDYAYELIRETAEEWQREHPSPA